MGSWMRVLTALMWYFFPGAKGKSDPCFLYIIINERSFWWLLCKQEVSLDTQFSVCPLWEGAVGEESSGGEDEMADLAGITWKKQFYTIFLLWELEARDSLFRQGQSSKVEKDSAGFLFLGWITILWDAEVPPVLSFFLNISFSFCHLFFFLENFMISGCICFSLETFFIFFLWTLSWLYGIWGVIELCLLSE